MSAKRLQVLFDNQTIDGTSVIAKAGGCEYTDSGREIQRMIKLTGTLGGAKVVIEVDFEDDDFAPVTNVDGTVIELTAVGAYEIFLAPDMRLRAVLSDASGTTDVNLKLS